MKNLKKFIAGVASAAVLASAGAVAATSVSAKESEYLTDFPTIPITFKKLPDNLKTFEDVWEKVDYIPLGHTSLWTEGNDDMDVVLLKLDFVPNRIISSPSSSTSYNVVKERNWDVRHGNNIWSVADMDYLNEAIRGTSYAMLPCDKTEFPEDTPGVYEKTDVCGLVLQVPKTAEPKTYKWMVWGSDDNKVHQISVDFSHEDFEKALVNSRTAETSKLVEHLSEALR